MRASWVIVVEAALHGMMLGHTLLLDGRLVIGDRKSAKCSEPMLGGGEFVLVVDEEVFAGSCRAYSDGSVGRAVELCAGVEAMRRGLAYAGIKRIKPILAVVWMPLLCQVLCPQGPLTVIEGELGYDGGGFDHRAQTCLQGCGIL